MRVAVVAISSGSALAELGVGVLRVVTETMKTIGQRRDLEVGLGDVAAVMAPRRVLIQLIAR